MNSPTYLVQTNTNELYGYWNLTILICDLTSLYDLKTIWVRSDGPSAFHYGPITLDELKAKQKEMNHE